MIQKNIFQSWCTKVLPPPVQALVNSFKAANPDYTYHLYDDADMDRFVDEYFPGEIAQCYHRLNIIVAKVDFWRYLVLYQFGGVYLDMDSAITGSLAGLIRDEDEAIITAEGNPNLYVQWALIFSKGHPILKKTIDFVVDNIKNNRFPNDLLRMTGPPVFTRGVNAIHQELFDGHIIRHADIRADTDVTYRNGDTSYRLFGVDFQGFFVFKHHLEHYLYSGKKHWRQESQERPVLR